MTTADPAKGQSQTAPQPMSSQRLDRILAATRAELARADQQRPDHCLITSENENQN